MEPSPLAQNASHGRRLTSEGCGILTLSAAGWTTTEVTEMLGHRPEAVRSMLVSAINKLGAHSKLEAVIIAIRHGLIELSGD